MKNQAFLSKAQGCLTGVCLGDALGMPVETLSHEQIISCTDGVGITTFVDPIQRRVKDTQHLTAGDTTDDWQLTRTVARSLIRTRGVFDLADCVREHVAEYKRSLFGWGRTTEEAIKDIAEGRRVVGRDALPVALSGRGCGNGVMMKIAPLAISEYLPKDICEGLWKPSLLLGGITHPDTRASLAAYALALYLQALFHKSVTTQAEGLEYLGEVIDLVRFLEGPLGIHSERVSIRLALVPWSLESAESLSKNVGCGFFALDTIAFTLGIFLRNIGDFRAGVLEAVNEGGDTDTNASVVGALLGANLGIEGIPLEWINFRPHFKEPALLAHALVDVCSRP